MPRLVVAITVLLAACGSDPVALDDYERAVHEAQCRYLVKCGDIEDVETCQRLEVGLRFRLTATERAAIDMGRLRFDGERARECLDALAERSCDLTSESNRVPPDACLGVLTGTLPDGEACTDDAQCIARQCDKPVCNTACCTGTCVGEAAPARAKDGESCEATACEAGLFCDPDVQTCAPLRAREAFCASGEECGYGLACVQGATCEVLPALGQSCSGPCRDRGTTCGSSGTCVEVALAGEACQTSADCASVYRCDAGKRCVAGAAVGAQCTVNQRCADAGAICDIPEFEATGTCVLPRPDGGSCTRNAHCASLTCDTATLLCVPEPVCI
jgi:Dickkopf N-terminal cysteine-rich region